MSETGPEIGAESLLLSDAPNRSARIEHAAAGRDRRGFRLRRLLLFLDASAFAIAFGIVAGAGAAIGSQAPLREEGLILILTFPLWIFAANLLGLYHLSERKIDLSVADELPLVVLTTTVWSWSFIITSAAVITEPVSAGFALSLWATVVLTIPAVRVLGRRALAGRDWRRQFAMVVGSDEDLALIGGRLERRSDELEVVGSIRIDERLSGSPELVADAVLSRVATLKPDRIILASLPGDLAARTELIRRLGAAKLHIDLVSSEPDALLSRAGLTHIEGLPILSLPPLRLSRTARAAKRGADFVFSALGLFLLAPLLGWVAVRVKMSSAGPALYRSERVGKGGRRFEMLKFRTMNEGADRGPRGDSQIPGTKDPEDKRVTPYGRELRRRSIDELPQLWNVLKGEMSLVGPRPLPQHEANAADGEHGEVRSRVRPGMTGAWQTMGRSEIPFEDMLKLDYTYVAAWSLSEDLRMLLRTVGAVVRGRGAY